ncbi:hypothetical protein CBM2634_B20018 [Cupriavidus taiwanensis]|uniref:Uncharacterized protein n=1 Tax=Cupriavidus taiwanensis TaxID=164546 RepID=A0A375J980_9BURK|nr:hypothetical protein CBM2634_B20018 [Cupriavidus taiwanensis]
MKPPGSGYSAAFAEPGRDKSGIF